MKRLILRNNECYEVDEECLRKKEMQHGDCMPCKKEERGKDDRWDNRRKKRR